MTQRLFSHIDLRVRDGVRALAFYDVLLKEFGFSRVEQFTKAEPVWRRAKWQANDEFFGFVVDPHFVPNHNRIAFHGSSFDHVDRVTAALRNIDAPELDGPQNYGGSYYATFFNDPDGNRLEVCFLIEHGGVAGDDDQST